MLNFGRSAKGTLYTFNVAATFLKIEIRLHAHPVGTYTQSGTGVKRNLCRCEIYDVCEICDPNPIPNPNL